MRVAAITKFKVGAIYEILHKLGWSQSELARQSGVSQGVIGDILNFKRKPSPEQATAIQRAFGEAGEYIDVLAIWPDDFKPLKSIAQILQVRDVNVTELERGYIHMLENAAPDSPLDVLERKEEGELGRKHFETLPYRTRKIIELRGDGLTFHEIGDKFRISSQAALNAFKKGIHQLWHSMRDQMEPWETLVARYGLTEQQLQRLRDSGVLDTIDATKPAEPAGHVTTAKEWNETHPTLAEESYMSFQRWFDRVYWCYGCKSYDCDCFKRPT